MAQTWCGCNVRHMRIISIPMRIPGGLAGYDRLLTPPAEQETMQKVSLHSMAMPS